MENLQSMLKDLYLISGLNLSIYDIHENLITSYPEHNSPFCHLIKSTPEGAAQCLACDHKAFERVKSSGQIDIYNCDFHLYEAVVPIYTYGVHSGYLMMGQTLTDSAVEKKTIKNAAKDYVDSEKRLDEAISKISFHTKEQILSFASIIDICAKYLTLTNRLEAKNKNLAIEIKNYLNAHYNHAITLSQLCNYFYVSKSTLLNKFKEEYGITIHQYLLDYRFQKSLELLANSTQSIQEIALACGFQDANYYTKAFKAKYQITPTHYRETINTSKN